MIKDNANKIGIIGITIISMLTIIIIPSYILPIGLVWQPMMSTYDCPESSSKEILFPTWENIIPMKIGCSSIADNIGCGTFPNGTYQCHRMQKFEFWINPNLERILDEKKGIYWV